MATTKKSKKTTTSKSKDKKDEKVVSAKAKTESVKAKATVKDEGKTSKKDSAPECDKTTFKGAMKGFFSKKFDPTENILTIFSRPQIYGALIGEVIGTMLLTMTVICLGMTNPLYIWFAMTAITVAVFGLSGANLNPIITVGMMATRRMSAIRGVLYILAQILGSWLAILLTSGLMGWGNAAAGAEMPKMAEVADGTYWQVLVIELIGAIIFAFFFSRALAYKKSPLTFGAIVGTGLAVAIIYVYIVSQSYFGLKDNFIMNPAIALMYQILPTSGGDFGEIMGKIWQALSLYVVVPMLGGVIAFYLSDFSSRLSGEWNRICNREQKSIEKK